MIYIKDDSQDTLNADSDFIMDIKGDPKVLAAECAMVLYRLFTMDSRIAKAAIKSFWEEVKNDSRTE